MSYGLYNNEFAQINNQYTWMNVAAAPGPYYPTDGLIDYWGFEDTLAGVNGNTWTADDGLTYTYEAIGSGKTIVQTNKGRLYISESMFPNFEANVTEWTIAMWGYFSSVTLGGFVGMGKGTPHTILPGWYGWCGYQYTRLGFGNFGCDTYVTGLSLKDTWFHMFLSLSRTGASTGTYTFYINNVLKSTQTNRCLPTTASNEFQLFRLWQSQYGDNGSKYDDVFLYSKVLSEAERTQIYEHTR